jgi:hypothetical protein
MSSPTEPDTSLEDALEVARGAYRERAHLVALLASMYPSSIGHTDASCPEYAVVIVNFPTGQAAWHVSPDDLDLFQHVTRTDVDLWDGHTTAQKYQRINAYTLANATGTGEVV